MTVHGDRRTTVRVVLTMLALVLTLTGVGAFAAATPAAASARGCNTIHPGTVGGFPVATGTYCVELNGSGTYVNYVGGGFNSVGNVCNWQITAEFFDTHGRWYQTKTGPMHNSCSHRANDTISIRANKRAGSMCSTLRQNGGRVTSVCHNIH